MDFLFNQRSQSCFPLLARDHIWKMVKERKRNYTHLAITQYLYYTWVFLPLFLFQDLAVCMKDKYTLEKLL